MIGIVTLERVSDGIRREASDEYENVEQAEYLWTEGNWACDCNRALAFARAAGEPDPEPRPCGSVAFRAVSIRMGEAVVTLDDAA